MDWTTSGGWTPRTSVGSGSLAIGTNREAVHRPARYRSRIRPRNRGSGIPRASANSSTLRDSPVRPSRRATVRAGALLSRISPSAPNRTSPVNPVNACSVGCPSPGSIGGRRLVQTRGISRNTSTPATAAPPVTAASARPSGRQIRPGGSATASNSETGSPSAAGGRPPGVTAASSRGRTTWCTIRVQTTAGRKTASAKPNPPSLVSTEATAACNSDRVIVAQNTRRSFRWNRTIQLR